MHDCDISRSLFLHHALRLDILPLIIALQSNKIIPTLVPTQESGWGPVLARAGKKILYKNTPNYNGWSALISNISIGYSCWNPKLVQQLFQIMTATHTKENILLFLQNKCEDHHDKDPLAFIALICNALFCLPKPFQDKALLTTLESIPHQTKSPFLMALKKAFTDTTIPFEAVVSILQVYGCFLHCSEQSYKPTELPKGLLSDTCVTISQKIDGKNYAIVIPLHLSDAIQTLLKLTSEQLESLNSLIVHITPKSAFKKNLIPIELFFYVDDLLFFLEKSNNSLKKLGYNLLLIYSLKTPKPWLLTTLVKNLNLGNHVSLKEVLKGFPDTIEMHRITSPILTYLENSKKSQLKLCMALASTNNPELIQEATKIHLSIEDISLAERIDFIKILLPNHSGAVGTVLITLQKENRLFLADEIKLFNVIAEEIKKSPKNFQMVTLSDYAEIFFLLKKTCPRNMFKNGQCFT